ncbi:MAG TPA: hypothetical protein VLI06_07925, partial [Solimonas sp.]|nr:hypothetical protein [Solimonas sp.]
RVWDTATGAPLIGPLRHDDEVNSAVFSADGRKLLTASDDGTARVWETATGRLIGVPVQVRGRIYKAVWDNREDRLAVATGSIEDKNEAPSPSSGSGRSSWASVAMRLPINAAYVVRAPALELSRSARLPALDHLLQRLSSAWMAGALLLMMVISQALALLGARRLGSSLPRRSPAA